MLKNVIDALVNKLYDTPYSEVSISELCRVANISRMTFYRHFNSKDEVIESYIKRLKGMEDLAAAYPGVTKSYAIQAGRELRVIVGAEEVSDDQAARLSTDIAQKIQEEMTYPGQVKITVIRETRSIAFAK